MDEQRGQARPCDNLTDKGMNLLGQTLLRSLWLITIKCCLVAWKQSNSPRLFRLSVKTKQRSDFFFIRLNKKAKRSVCKRNILLPIFLINVGLVGTLATQSIDSAITFELERPVTELNLHKTIESTPRLFERETSLTSPRKIQCIWYRPHGDFRFLLCFSRLQSTWFVTLDKAVLEHTWINHRSPKESSSYGSSSFWPCVFANQACHL